MIEAHALHRATMIKVKVTYLYICCLILYVGLGMNKGIPIAIRGKRRPLDFAGGTCVKKSKWVIKYT